MTAFPPRLTEQAIFYRVFSGDFGLIRKLSADALAILRSQA